MAVIKFGPRGTRERVNLLRNEDGQALVITLLSLTILLGFVGLATDVGTLFYTKRQLQIAADSAGHCGRHPERRGCGRLSAGETRRNE